MFVGSLWVTVRMFPNHALLVKIDITALATMEPISQHVSLHMIVMLVGSAVDEHHGNLRRITLRAMCFDAHISTDITRAC